MMDRLKRWMQRWLAVEAHPLPTQPARPKGVKVGDEALARSKRPAVAYENPFAVDRKLHPESASAALAMDSACNEVAIWGNEYSSRINMGQAFLGFPILAEMATIAEYRRASETIARHMTRKWIEFHAQGDDARSERIAAIETELKNLDVMGAFQKSAEKDGLYGRAHLLLDLGDWDDPQEMALPIGDGQDDVSKAKCSPDRPLKRIESIEPIWCYPLEYNARNPLDPTFYKPQVWGVNGTRMHCTRLLTFVGREVPDMLKPAYSFGGLSLSQMGKPCVDGWLETRASVLAAMSAYSNFVFKTRMAETVEGAGDQLFKRAELANNMRENGGLWICDMDSEDFVNVAAPLGSLDALQGQAQEHMASVWGIPNEIFNGIQPAGLNASSDGQIKIFNDWIHSCQERLFRPNLTRIIHFIELSLFGDIDDGITFSFKDLGGLSDIERSEKNLVDAQADQINTDIGAISAAEVRTRLASDPTSPYDGLDPDDIPDMPGESDDDSEEIATYVGRAPAEPVAEAT